MKFKVGDIVIGNELTRVKYGYTETCTGIKVMVVAVDNSRPDYLQICVEITPGQGKNGVWWVNEEAFNLMRTKKCHLPTWF